MKPELQFLANRDRVWTPLALAALEVDTKDAGDPTKPVQFQGYGSVWNSVDSYGDTMLPGAFKDSLKARQPMMFMQHNPRVVPGKWLSASEDSKGLKLVGELTPGHSTAADLAASLKHGSLSGLSVGGYTQHSTPTDQGGRLISQFDLWEVSPVSMPAENDARIDTASVKAMIESCDSLAQFEDMLRDAAGLSKAAAKILVSRFAKVARGESVGSEHLKELGRLSALVADSKVQIPPWS